MINNLRLGVKSIRFAYGIKSNLLLMLGFLGAGITFMILGSGTLLSFYGNFMLMGIAMLPAQMIFSLSVSNLVLASPLRKRLQTSVPATLTCCNTALIYLMMAVYRLIRVWGNPQLAEAMSGELMVVAGMIFLIMLYLGVAYKYFGVSVLMAITMALLLSYRKEWEGISFRMSLFGQGLGGVALTALTGIGIVVLGGFLQYLISLLVYRAPMSKMAQAAPLRREL